MFKEISGCTGSVVAGACCLAFAPLLAVLSAIGAGFLINDAILIPLFVAFLAYTVWVLWSSRKTHGRTGPFYLGAGAAVVAFAALWFLAPLSYAAMAALIAASVWNIVAHRQSRAVPQASETV
jgi:mercuric ion transport protein